MKIQHRTALAIFGAAWLAGLGLLWPQTVLSGYAGQAGMLATAKLQLARAMPALRKDCAHNLMQWFDARSRQQVSQDLPTGVGYAHAVSAAMRSYASAGCPTGAFLMAGSMARTTGAAMRAAAGLK